MKAISTRQLIRRSLLLGSFLLFPVTIFYLSPALIIMAAAAGSLSGSAMVFLGQFAASLLLGRAFCGWICPAAGMQEACFIAQSRPVNGRRSDWIKYAIWAPWIGLILFLFVKNGIHSLNFFFMMDSPISLSSPAQYPIYFIVTGLIFLLSLTLGRRGFCHSACWMAPFMIIGARLQRLLRLPALHLSVAPDRCVACRACASACPMSLDVTRMVQTGSMTATECILCGNCVDTCKQQALTYSFSLPHSETKTKVI